MSNFVSSDWMDDGGRFQLLVIADPTGARFCAVESITADDGVSVANVDRMDIFDRGDGTRATAATISAAQPFDGSVEFVQGPEVPGGFVPLPWPEEAPYD